MRVMCDILCMCISCTCVRACLWRKPQAMGEQAHAAAVVGWPRNQQGQNALGIARIGLMFEAYCRLCFAEGKPSSPLAQATTPRASPPHLHIQHDHHTSCDHHVYYHRRAALISIIRSPCVMVQAPDTNSDTNLHDDAATYKMQTAGSNGVHPSGASDSSLEAHEVSHNSTLENITNLAGSLLTDLPLELPALEFFYEASTELPEDEAPTPRRASSQSLLVKAEVNKLLDEYEDLDIGNLEESVRTGIVRLLRHVIAQQRKPKRVKLRDKILFVLGTCDLWCATVDAGCVFCSLMVVSAQGQCILAWQEPHDLCVVVYLESHHPLFYSLGRLATQKTYACHIVFVVAACLHIRGCVYQCRWRC